MKNKKIKINILDIVIVIFIVTTVIGIFAKTRISSLRQKGQNEKAVIELNIIDDTKMLAKTLNNGDSVRCKNGDYYIGTVKSAVNRKNVVYVNDNGEYKRKFIDDKYRVLVMLDSEVVTNENGMFVNGKFYVAPGLILELETDNAQFEAEITSVTIQ